MMENFATVSVCMITFNQEDFIAQAIEGVLMQKTSFPIELIIGEDYSSDNTRKICKEYKAKFPNIIKLLLQEKNQGMVSNFIATLTACTGKYIALCEGDDYWTDPLKLQKQIDFLENHADFAICFHDAEIIADDPDIRKNYQIKYLNNSNEFTIDDLLYEGNLMHTPTVVFRRQENYPEINAIIADYFLHLHNAMYGKIKRLEGNWACYRVHEGGVFSQRKNWPMWRKIDNSIVHVSALEKAKKMYATNRKRKRLFNGLIYIEYNRRRFYFVEEADKKQIRRVSFKLLKRIAGTRFFTFKNTVSIIISIISPMQFYKSHKNLDLHQ